MRFADCQGCAGAMDVTQFRETPNVDLVFRMKSLPCLEQIESGAALRLSQLIGAKHWLISFPVHALAGKSKGMAEQYESRSREMVAARSRGVKQFDFPGELVFCLTK
jgi:hypothetical protein